LSSSIVYVWLSSAPAVVTMAPPTEATRSRNVSATRRMAYGPSGTWLGSQSRVPPSVNGVELSPGLRSFAPGHRLRLSRSKPAAPKNCSVTVLTGGGSSGKGTMFGGSVSAPAGVLNVNVLKVVPMRPMPPFASTIPDVPKSLNHPTSSGV
jgi:hypothetical protein